MTTVETVQCDTARELLAQIAPTAEGFMRAYDDSWLFRGQGDATWDLMPAAFREQRKMSCFATDAAPDWPEWTNRHQINAETTAITAFLDEADRAGLAIPGDIDTIYQDLHVTLEKPFAPIAIEDQLGWPPRSARHVVALAQHYGIPTRLLDCTRSSYIAAYFAASDVLRRNRFGEMAIWAISSSWHVPNQHVFLPIYPVLVMAPYASNPNLRAQQGIHLGVPVDLTLTRSAVRADFAPLLSLIDAELRPHGLAAVRKFTLPTDEAPHLLWYLRKHGVTASQLFPGYAGAARGALELHWHKPE
jgi:hypothetical protein